MLWENCSASQREAMLLVPVWFGGLQNGEGARQADWCCVCSEVGAAFKLGELVQVTGEREVWVSLLMQHFTFLL